MKRLALESAVIILSILAAFALDTWWDERQERHEERETLQALRTEFTAARSNILFYRSLQERILQSVEAIGDTLHRAYLQRRPAVVLPDTALGWAYIPPTTTVSLGTLQGLVSAGRLGVIGDPELRTALASWGIALAELAEEELDSRAYVYSDLHQVLRTRTDTYGLWSAASRLFNGTLSPEEMAGTRRVPVDSEVVGVFDLRGNLLRHGIDEFAPLIAEVDGILMLIDQALSDPAGGARQFQRSVALEDSAETSANVSLGDLNADGHLDVVLVKGRHWPLLDLVRLGDGTGSLRPAYPVGSVPDRSYSGVLVDMDEDGDLDIVVSNDNPDPKVVHLNDGSGRYQVGSTFGRPEWSTRHVSVADLNGDGLPDVVLANRHPEGSALSYICFGVGGGRFAEECVGFARGSATTVTPADFNRDGALDLAVPYRDGGQSYIYLNDGSGGFADRLPFGPPNAAIRSARAADLNGDGILDLVIIDQASGPAMILGRTEGGFNPPEPLGDQGSTPYALAVADLDGNGRTDVIVGYVESRPVVYFNDGPRRFTPVPFGDGEGSAYGFAVGDVDEDGFLDIAMARSGARNMLYFGGAR